MTLFSTPGPKPRYKRKSNGQFDGSEAREKGKRGVAARQADPVPFAVQPGAAAAYSPAEEIDRLELALAPATGFGGRRRQQAARRQLETTFGPIDWAS